MVVLKPTWCGVCFGSKTCITDHVSSSGFSFSFPNHVPTTTTTTTSGTIPSELGNLESVKDLYLHINQLSGTIPIELMIGKLGRSVEWFEVSHNQLTGTIPDALTRLRRVKGFHVDTNLLTGTIPDSLRNMFSLGM